MTGMSTMYDVLRPLAVEVQGGSNEGKILFTVLNVRKQAGLRWGPFVISE